MDALIEATIELLGEASPADIPIKAIAARAGVNHGLVHHYFGSKEDLVRAAIRRGAARLYDGQPADLRTGYTFRFLRQNPGLVRGLARIVLDGPGDLLEDLAPPRERLDGWIGQLEAQLAARGLAGTFDAPTLNAFVVAALMGWWTFRPLLAAAFRVPEDADDAIAGWLAQLDGMVAPNRREAR